MEATRSPENRCSSTLPRPPIATVRWGSSLASRPDSMLQIGDARCSFPPIAPIIHRWLMRAHHCALSNPPTRPSRTCERLGNSMADSVHLALNADGARPPGITRQTVRITFQPCAAQVGYLARMIANVTYCSRSPPSSLSEVCGLGACAVASRLPIYDLAEA
jgi:hypothetical protein